MGTTFSPYSDVNAMVAIVLDEVGLAKQYQFPSSLTSEGNFRAAIEEPLPSGSNTIGSVNAIQSGTWSVSVSSLPDVVVSSGSISVTSLPSISGTVAISSLPDVVVSSGSISVTSLPSISGTVSVSNFPSTQTVSGTVAISVLPDVTVSNFPYSQTTAHAYTSVANGSTVTASGKAILQLIGTGGVASIYISGVSSSSPALNSGTALTNGAYYEIEVHVMDGDTITVSGATVGRIILIEGG